ncbi:MAG: hypothetical protein AAGF12_28950 [Myxococcota bacterium]
MFGLFRKKQTPGSDGPQPPGILLEAPSPHGNAHAVVEADERCVYFYLCGANPDFGMRTCWVRNLVRAPEDVDWNVAQQGQAPLNPAKHCRAPLGSALPLARDLGVVWLPEGNGIALYEKSTLLAIIPPWSGTEAFHGYAAEAVGSGPLASTLAYNQGSDALLASLPSDRWTEC